jgi:hypothetical protein
MWAIPGPLAAVAAPLGQSFHHDRTLFPLTGQHQRLECDECHHGGRYESLPTVCGSCHQSPVNHVIDQRAAASVGGCHACHNTTTWSSARFVHSPAMTGGVCSTCHNGRRAVGKPAGHIANAAECDTCHKTSSFDSAGFRHDGSAAGRCDTCHNGQTATGKPGGHLATSSQCDQCHRTTGWASTTYANHNNPRLIGGHAGLDCKVCHPQSFSAVFYRDGVQFGFCSNCHRRDYNPGEEDHNNASLQVNANCANCHAHAGYRFDD